jgi:hypothetical protein
MKTRETPKAIDRSRANDAAGADLFVDCAGGEGLRRAIA